MKPLNLIKGVLAYLLLGAMAESRAASYYVNDTYSPTNDIYTTAGGNDANTGTASAPKLTLGNVIATCNLQPGDVVYIDTGNYGSGVVISNTVVGTAGNLIRFQGSTNGTLFSGSGVNLTVRGQYLAMADIRTSGGSEGVALINANRCEFYRVWAVSNTLYSVNMSSSSSSNRFQGCVLAGTGTGLRTAEGGVRDNVIENSVIQVGGTAIAGFPQFFSIVGCILNGNTVFFGDAFIQTNVVANVFWGMNSISPGLPTLADVMRSQSGFRGNTVLDPLFANAGALDFHLQSPAGFVSNGVWVTNAAVGYSPALDFGPTNNPAWTNEPTPNGSRINAGNHGGTAEASKSRTNAWLLALSFNDGGNLIQTGRLEWVGGNLATNAQVDVQYSTNNGVSWSNVAAGVAATNETYVWVPTLAQQHPYVLWRVVSSTNPAIASTNAKAFSIRTQTNTTFAFYVNDAATNADVYCAAVGSNSNLGAYSNAPKRSLQAILDTYDLEGGDVVYVDTGDYTTNLTTTIARFDSGVAGRPVRILGSPNGAVFNRGNTSADTFELNTASYLEIENLRLTGGNAGLFGNGSADVALRNLQFTDNQTGVSLTGTRHVFERCLALNNAVRAFSGSTAVTNQWINGILWGSPTLLHGAANSLTVSNSILGGGTALFGQAVIPGDYNLVWQTGVGLTYATFSALQNAGIWTRSLYADPQFANVASNDFHLKSLMGRYDPATGLFATNDVVHSPAIDLGDPLSQAYTNEPSPNGNRLNAGLFGGTAQASKSRTNAWLQTLSYMDGGTLDAPAGSWLRWNGTNFAGGSTVTLWLSRDSGQSWEALATNVAAAAGQYFYQNTSTNDPSTTNALWKVSLEADTNVYSRTTNDFTYKNGPFIYYVNDGSTNGDVYCTAIGNNANLGTSAGSPLASLAEVVTRKQLGPGDRVYVDTGNYYFPATPVVLTSQDSGTSTNMVLIQGSTNRLAGGSQFGLSTITMNLGFDFQSGASNIVLRDVVVYNVFRGVAVSNSLNVKLEQVEVRGAIDKAYDLQANARSIELLRCVAHGGGIGVALQQATNATIRHSVFWQNTNAAVYVGSQVGVLVENSVLASTNANATLYSLAGPVGFSADYNGIHAGRNTRVGVNRTTGGRADNLAAWQALSGGQDLHSIPGDPLLADPAGYDYHLKTEQTLGRWQPNGQRTSDSVSSPLLDAGNPAADFAQEALPNGGRANIGRFGGTAEASIALPSPWLKTVSFGDAGIVTNGAVSLRWLAGGGFSNETVKVQVSLDGGKTWGTNVVSGIPATNGAAIWTVGGLPDTPAAIWRVACLERTNVTAQSTAFFALRNSPLTLFVATADTNGTIYVTNPGGADNWMATSNAPLNSLATAFDRYDLEPGDQIKVDTGTYAESVPIVIGMKNSGTTSNPVRVIGNAKAPYDASVLKRVSRTIGAYAVQLAYAEGVQFSSLMVSNAWTGVQMENSRGISMERVRVGYCVTNAIYMGDNTRLDMTGSIVEQSLFAGLHANTGAVAKVFNSLMRNNDRANVFLLGGNVEVKNSILAASGAGRYVYYRLGPGTLASDYNNVRATEGAYVGGVAGQPPDRFLIDWQISSGFTNDMNSFGYEPRFHDEAALDFHLKSQFGRYDPVSEGYVYTDTNTSILIDLGDPAFSYANEPATNGNRINVGLYGNSVEASKSSGQGSLVPLTMSDGGTIRGLAKLYWSFNGLSNNTIVSVQFSADGGATWTNIATNAYADVGRTGLSWDTTNFTSTAQGVWRVMTTTNVPPIIGQTEILFALKNDPLAYFVNDASTNGDVYCSAPGRSTNTGLSASSPMNSLEQLLGRYKVEHGDTVYVDTGVYPRSAPLVISVPSTVASNRLVIQGSTNEAGGGTIFTNSSGPVIELEDSRFVDLRDFTLQGGDQGVVLTQSSSNRLIRVRSIGAHQEAFNLSVQSDQNQFIQCAALLFSRTGFHVATPLTVEVAPTTNFWANGAIAGIPADSNGVATATSVLAGVKSGRLYVSNSVFVANGPSHTIYAATPESIRGDYNCYYQPFSNAFATVTAGSPAFGVEVRIPGSLGEWAQWNLCESNSMAANPLFANLAAGDLHPKSQGGRYSPGSNSFVADDETSPLINTADPLGPWSQESEPNGRRADIGPYGNHPLASRTPTNGTFVLVSLNQGGVVRGTQVLKWVARGEATNPATRLVNIQLSTNSGLTFSNIGASTAVSGSFTWNSTSAPSLAMVRWKVQDQGVPAWAQAADRDFVVHNSNLTYYVNDAATNHDVYTTAAGSANNTGLSPNSPLASLQDVLSRHDVEPGDLILIDGGEYARNAPIAVGFQDSGTPAEPVRIQGSTNHLGSAIVGTGLRIDNVRGLTLRNLAFTGQTMPVDVVSIVSSENVALEQVDLLGGLGSGVDVGTSSNVVLRNFAVAGMATNGVASRSSYNTRIEFGVIWSNGVAQIATRSQLEGSFVAAREASFVSVSNCIMGSFGLRKPIYEIRGNLFANDNDLYMTDGALAALSYAANFGREFDSAQSWANATSNDTRSLSHEPRFANPAAGDFHLKSFAGRYDPVATNFVLDPASQNSPAIDAGAKTVVCTEPVPNGARVNLGRFGNTDQASKTPTNPALALISFHDGGRAVGTVPIYWNARGFTTNAAVTVTISYSADAGATWTTLVSGVSAAGGQWLWNSTNSEQSVQAMLKIEGSDGSLDQSGRLFSVRNRPFVYYVNDAFTNNDVYCSNAIGNNTNSGLSASAPMAGLNELLAKYDLESGDVVYIDTGVYGGLYPWRIAQADTAGDLGLPPVIFQGSTNSLLGGTILDRARDPLGIQVDYGVGVSVRNIAISNTVGSAVMFNDCYEAEAEGVVVRSGDVGFRMSRGSKMRIARCLVLEANTGVMVENWTLATNTVFPLVEHNVFWDTAGSAILIRGQNKATLRNNILSVKTGQYVYQLDSTDDLTSDYNSIWLASGSRVFRRNQSRDVSPVPIIYETVGAWAAASGQDVHSYAGDPLLANPAGGDFHLKSRVGRYQPGTGWTNDAVSSPLIDAGLPSSPAWTNEPTPNGARVNVGLYGGTAVASKSSTNSALYVLSLDRGGVASGQVALNWQAAGQATGHTVRLEVTIDDGATWVRVADGVPASLGGVVWNSLGLPSSALARWRVQDEQETNVVATSALNFVLHNGAVRYYVNDEFADGNDVYCTAAGSSTNSGVAPNSPKRWISEIVDAYNLEPGDVVYVDTGRYQTPLTTTIGDLDAGGISQDPSQQVTFLGSTNELAGGSLYIVSDPEVAGFQLNGAYGLRFKRLGIQGAGAGLAMDESYFIANEWVNIRGCEDGARALNSSNIVFSHSTLVGNRNAGIYFSGSALPVLRLDACVLWSNRCGVYLQQGYAQVSNSIFGMAAPNSFGYYMQKDSPQTGIQSDYNNLYVQHPSAAVGGFQTGGGGNARTSVYSSVASWTSATGQDGSSLANNPELADPGNRDFHLKSRAGRYKPGIGWLTDTNTSPLIDAGHPGVTSWTVEPDPNGRRLNLGLYGGTAEASKSLTEGWIIPVCYNDGGEASGDVELCWTVGGAATNYTVCIEFSRDDGILWTTLVCGWPASSGSYLWNSRPYGSTALGRWRISCVEDPSINATSLKRFILRNPPYPGAPSSIHYYVNDAITNGDIYCTAPGSEANDGLTPATPKDSLQAILDAWQLAPEDVVYVDAGTYPAGAPPIQIDQTDSGYDDLYVTIQGSTNPMAATVFQAPGGFSAPQAFSLQYAVNVRLNNLTIRNARIGVDAFQTIGCIFDGVRIENNYVLGMNLVKSENVRLIRSVLWNNKSPTGGVAIALAETALNVENSVLWGSPTAIAIGVGTVKATNSAFEARGPNGRIYLYSQNASAAEFRGDYNSYTRKNGALICEQQNLSGGSEYYNYMPTWSAASSSDWHSLTDDPLFANETDGDFHPRSPQGRFSDAAGTWTNDAPPLSPLVDAGSPAWAYDNEPNPNGDIIDIGAYGNTDYASKTQTNPPWLRAISYNEPGIISGNARLYWLHGGMPGDARVRLDYSTDLILWDMIATNLPAASREYTWNVSALPLSRALWWRVTYQSDTNVYSIAGPSTVKPTNFTFYVNDAITNGDIWCKGPGLPCVGGANPTNPATPAESLACLLQEFPVGAGDRILVDTGVYPVNDAARIVLDGRHSGDDVKGPVKLYASTNFQAGGALFVGNGTANGMDIQNARLIELYDFRFSQAQNGLAMENVANITLSGLEAFNNRSNGVSVLNGSEVTLRNSRLWKNSRYGYASLTTAGGQHILNSTLWGNAAGAAFNDKGVLDVTNSILCVTNATEIYTESGTGIARGDYNMYGLVFGSRMGSNALERASYESLRQWQNKGRDLHSAVLDPLFVDPTAGNFHLQSRAGYRSNGTWAVSTNTSWAIDAGDPATAWASEPTNNGGRVNLGAYGGTPEASRSDSSMQELLPTTLRDGGVAPNGQPLYWWYRGINPTNLVKIEYSPDRGSNWVLVASGIRVDSAPYGWFSSFEPTPEARWRIILLANTNVWGATPTNFIYRPRPITYYVNDASTNNDVYTTGPGRADCSGYSSNCPLDSIQAVLTRFQLVSDGIGGDEIRVDTGNYVVSNTVTITALNSGNGTNRTVIRGSTNVDSTGSWHQPAPGMVAPAFSIVGHDFELADLRLSGFSNGVSFNLASDCVLSDLDIRGSQGPGILMQQANNIRLQGVVIRDGLTNGIAATQSKTILLDGCVLWSNRWQTIVVNSSDAFVTNSVLEASGLGNSCYFSTTGATIRANYNDLFIRNGAQIAEIEGLQFEKLPQWVRSTAQDLYSLSTDPLFHDPGNGDFHLRSLAGRYQPGTGWVLDTPLPRSAHAIRADDPCPGVDPGPAPGTADYSPLIDMGSPRAAWSNEPMPNGNRRNIGRYGNTWQASKSNTNRWLLVVTAMSGGITYGRVNLIWGYSRSIPTNAVARLEYSRDNGNNWIRIGESAVGTGEYAWDSDDKLAGNEIWPSSPAARWRIFLLGDTNVWDMTDAYFGLRNSPFKYYLNDTSTNNDVYTSAIGDDCNLGFYSAAPKLTLINLLENVDLDPTDEIYIDTGVYRMLDTNAPIRWEASDGGIPGAPILVRGSTHTNGSLFVTTNEFADTGFFFDEASYLDLQDLRFSGESMEFKGSGLAVRNLGLSNGSMRIYGDGAVFRDILVDRGAIILSGQSNRLERMRQRWGGTTILGTNVAMTHSSVLITNLSATGIVVDAVSAAVSNCSVVAPLGSAIGKRGPGTLKLGHNILVAGGSDGNSVIAWEAGGLLSDWNNLLARGSAWIGNRDGKWEKLAYWQAASGQDPNSVSFEPLFQNEPAGDFHLKSVVGRWSPLLNLWDVDSVHSPLIDLGDPWIGTADEPLPNGYRRNLGAFGGTEQASKSRTNFWLTALTQNDGGVLKGSNVVLRWATSNNASSTVRLDYFDGNAWTNIAGGLTASSGSYTWNTTLFPDSFSALWRVVSEDDTNVWDQTDATFALRNHAQAFYVNDGDMADDVYCETNGSVAFNGLTPATPKLTLQAILDTYDLEGGDTVFLDTGTYVATSDVRIIWSRSGNTNADVVIQGNTNEPHTVLTRSGATNFPAVGIDVKASRLQLNHLAIQNIHRGILLDSNRNATVQGTIVSHATTGVSAEHAHNAQIRNSAFDRTSVGVSLNNTRTSVLENLTFVLPSVAGIRLVDTVKDTLQNNIFIPDVDAYAYSIGTATSLLTSAFLDYNLYDFGGGTSRFFEGGPADLRGMQSGVNNLPGLNKDFRSALTNADLAEIAFEPMDFHPLSADGRWTPIGWALDAKTSWAVDHGNPAQSFGQEPENNGGRRNIGMYGNTVQASKGNTNVFMETRTLNESGIEINAGDQFWPLIWSAHLVDGAETVQVEFSADSGETWSLLTNVSAYAEYFVFQARAEFQTVNGRWRIIGVNDTNLVATSCCDFIVKYFDLGFITGPKPVNGLMRMNWVGGLGGLRYRIEYSDDFGKTWNTWEEKYNGPAPINQSNFIIPSGESKLSYTFEDRTSYLRRTRWYRIWEIRN